jgi:hypothetical protein
LLPAWVAFLRIPSWIGATLAAATAFPTVTAKAEEASNIEYSGNKAINHI